MPMFRARNQFLILRQAAGPRKLEKLVAIDGRMPFGSPASAVPATLVHRPMFKRIYEVRGVRALTMSLWIDDLTLSGTEIASDTITTVRQVIRDGGFQTHKIEHLTTARPVDITGVPVAAGRVLAPLALHRRIQEGLAALRAAATDADRGSIIDKLLSALGTYRYHLGASTPEGRMTAGRMHALKQRRARMAITAVTIPRPSHRMRRRALRRCPGSSGCEQTPASSLSNGRPGWADPGSSSRFTR